MAATENIENLETEHAERPIIWEIFALEGAFTRASDHRPATVRSPSEILSSTKVRGTLYTTSYHGPSVIVLVRLDHTASLIRLEAGAILTVL